MNETLNSLQFTIPEILALIGLVQCVYILVYMAFRSGGFQRAAVPFLYFMVLGAAFFSAFAKQSFHGLIEGYGMIEWALWFMGPPLSVLLMIQIIRITEPPRLKDFWVLLLIPAAYGVAVFMNQVFPDIGLGEWLILSGLLAGIISVMAMWMQRPMLVKLPFQPGGRDRYWLVVAIVLADLLFLATALAGAATTITSAEIEVTRTILGLAFVYLAGTSLFRIYPQAIRLVERTQAQKARPLSREDQDLALKIEKLLDMDKVYHEPTYSRANLAQELGVSESIISRVVNQYFGKTLPQLFSERRLNDAKRLLQETDAPIKTVAEDSGFNSIASFNRVFRETEGITPGEFREKNGSKTGT